MSLSPMIEALRWRVCKNCGERKLLEEFYPSHRGRFGHRLTCARCEMSGAVERVKALPADKANKAGPSQHRRLELAGRPKPEVCEICERPPGKTGLQFDHDHKTGRFRGWICTNCNTTLGQVREDISTLATMIDYLLDGGTVVCEVKQMRVREERETEAAQLLRMSRFGELKLSRESETFGRKAGKNNLPRDEAA